MQNYEVTQQKIETFRTFLYVRLVVHIEVRQQRKHVLLFFAYVCSIEQIALFVLTILCFLVSSTG